MSYRVFDEVIAPGRPAHVIVDLRFNDGGDFGNSILFTEALPRFVQPGGKIFVLVGPNTFSAALVMAALIKGHAGDRAMLVGDEMGDGHRFWAEGGVIELPNSGIPVRYSDGLHDWVHGCDGEEYCYWPVTAFRAEIDSLEPDIRVPFNFADYASGRDAVLDAALSLAN